MSRTFIQMQEGITVDLPENGGMIRSGSDEIHFPEIMPCFQTGIGFGPLHVGTPGHVEIDRLEFLPDQDGGGIWFLSAGTVGVAGASVHTDADAIPNDPEVRRRGVLTLFATLVIGSGIGTGAATAAEGDDETVTLSLAEFRISEINAPVSVSILQAVDGVLPTGTKMLVDQENTRVGELVEAGESAELLQETGKVTVYIRGSKPQLQQLLAWALSWLPQDESLTYKDTLPSDRKASEYIEDDVLDLTSHPAVVEPIENSGRSRTEVKVGDTTIPNIENGSSDAGVWYLLDGTLTYQVGAEPPESNEFTVKTRLQAWQTFL